MAQGTIPAFETLQQAGFMDLQDVACIRWGIPIKPTCKSATRKDFCYISRELQGLLHSVLVDDEIFPDHAVIRGVFHSPAQCIPRHVWVSPQPFPWPAHWEVDPNFWTNTDSTCDIRYQALWHHIEHQAAKAVPYPVPKKCFGRASTHQTRQLKEGRISPPKRARQGEIQPHYVSASFRHSQWLRQVRRLQAFVRYSKKDPSNSQHIHATWGAILRSTGFSPSFAGWWTQCSHRTPGSPSNIPWVPPQWHVAEKIFDSVLLAFRALESELQRASRQYARQRREQNPNLIFKDIKTHREKGWESSPG